MDEGRCSEDYAKSTGLWKKSKKMKGPDRSKSKKIRSFFSELKNIFDDRTFWILSISGTFIISSGPFFPPKFSQRARESCWPSIIFWPRLLCWGKPVLMPLLGKQCLGGGFKTVLTNVFYIFSNKKQNHQFVPSSCQVGFKHHWTPTTWMGGERCCCH